MRRLLVRYGLAMTSVMLVAFLVPLGVLARNLAQERALAAGRQDAQSVAVFAGGAAQDHARLEAAVLAVNDSLRRTTVFVPDAELTQGVQQSWLVLAGVGALLIIVTVVAGDRIAARLSRSVLDLSEVAGRLGAGDLTARVDPSGPAEVASVGRVLNELGARVAGLLADERELVADLSHRLRTPITALRLDVEMLDDSRERDRLTDHVDDLVGAVDAIVWTARHPAHDAPASRCDAASVVGDRAMFWGVLAADQGRDLRVAVPVGPVEVRVSAAELGAALDVLVDNVFSHTPAGTGFALEVHPGDERGEGTARVVVEDDGPGLAPLGPVARGQPGLSL